MAGGGRQQEAGGSRNEGLGISCSVYATGVQGKSRTSGKAAPLLDMQPRCPNNTGHCFRQLCKPRRAAFSLWASPDRQQRCRQGMRVRRGSLHPREELRPRARGTDGPTAKTPEPLALGALGPSLVPCTLRVRLGGRHGGSATSCFCVDPCTHSVQDLNRLTCFRQLCTVEISNLRKSCPPLAHAALWKLRGWTGSSGPVSNVPLWELLLDTLSAHTGSIKFIKVPSHVDILGNNEADRLAEQGRFSHPRCPVLKTPSRDFIMPTYTPPTKRQRRTTVAELGSIVQVLNFSPYKDSMGGSVV